MSALVATGCTSSCSHGVSVVPITQYLDHGMMNSTDFSVCRISPTSPAMRLTLQTQKSVLFIIPWSRYGAVGTTAIPWARWLVRAVATSADVDYADAPAYTALARP